MASTNKCSTSSLLETNGAGVRRHALIVRKFMTRLGMRKDGSVVADISSG
jgi:hypothetical protein